ncbi:MAG TPA: hypothetical protein VGZ22_26960 [Isosphaeraceae bacterium]|jgi:hypothetical protein|nr:hypothetical protein [Isosphaeraceae bacterium]
MELSKDFPDREHDPYFFTKQGVPEAPRRRWRAFRWTVIHPLLLLSGCNLLMNGNPLPFRWGYVERLSHPVAVRQVTSQALTLADGRGVRLPFIARIPHDNRLFAKAIKQGVEVNGRGVFGLLRFRSTCGHDFHSSYTYRVDLSALAGALDPSGIDDSIVSPEVIANLKEAYAFHQREPSSSLLGSMRNVRDAFGAAARPTSEETAFTTIRTD